MNDNQVIPGIAVEAALNALFPEGVGTFKRDAWTPTIEAILKAASPQMTSVVVNVHPSAGDEESIGLVALKHYR